MNNSDSFNISSKKVPYFIERPPNVIMSEEPRISVVYQDMREKIIIQSVIITYLYSYEDILGIFLHPAMSDMQHNQIHFRSNL